MVERPNSPGRPLSLFLKYVRPKFHDIWGTISMLYTVPWGTVIRGSNHAFLENMGCIFVTTNDNKSCRKSSATMVFPAII